MGFRTALPRLLALALILAGLALVGAGCGAPKHRAEDFVGKWRAEGAQAKDILLELAPDGTGSSKFWRPPYGTAIRWSVVGDDLVLAAQDGTLSGTYRYRFDSPNGMVLTVDGKEHLLVKVK